MKWSSVCEHGKFILRCGEKTGLCKTCDKQESLGAFYVPKTEGFFNHGLGCVTYGTRDAEKKAKRMGLTPVGDAKPDAVFRKEKVDTITPILEEGRRKIHNLGAY